MKKSEVNLIEEETKYVAFLLKKLQSDNFKRNVTKEEFDKTKQKYDKAKLKFKFLKDTLK